MLRKWNSSIVTKARLFVKAPVKRDILDIQLVGIFDQKVFLKGSFAGLITRNWKQRAKSSPICDSE